MIIAIDGPAGAGKSTVTRLLAEELGFQYLDTGAMYRAVTWAAIERGVPLDDPQALLELAQSLRIEFDGDRVLVDGQDVSAEIRSANVTRNVVSIADSAIVRNYLVELQREMAKAGKFVCEGRDQGTVAFPDAFCKFYLTASERYRAQRRVEQMESAGEFVDYDQVIREQRIRDRQDLNREVGRLQKAPDAIEINTDHKSIEQVIAELAGIVRHKCEIKDSGSPSD